MPNEAQNPNAEMKFPHLRKSGVNARADPPIRLSDFGVSNFELRGSRRARAQPPQSWPAGFLDFFVARLLRRREQRGDFLVGPVQDFHRLWLELFAQRVQLPAGVRQDGVELHLLFVVQPQPPPGRCVGPMRSRVPRPKRIPSALPVARAGWRARRPPRIPRRARARIRSGRRRTVVSIYFRSCV